MNTNIIYKDNLFKVRFATIDDAEIILNFIKELAIYEKLLDSVTATNDLIKDSLFVKKEAEVLIGEENGVPIGFALFFHNYSTFLGKSNLFLEDLFVLKQSRGKGYGKKLFSAVAKIAVDRKCERLDWHCLDWNTSSIDFYKKLGANHLIDWTLFRLVGNDLINVSKSL